MESHTIWREKLGQEYIMKEGSWEREQDVLKGAPRSKGQQHKQGERQQGPYAGGGIGHLRLKNKSYKGKLDFTHWVHSQVTTEEVQEDVQFAFEKLIEELVPLQGLHNTSLLKEELMRLPGVAKGFVICANYKLVLGTLEVVAPVDDSVH
ncbi:hypothetical protein DSO57_1004798 [Entomophthora muscae]|uniref:Uncharacterized protein n=1 Tax=Entomophthora muscae TaxID=34485 RepID=A0ACC2UT02_9FUNG|nr:hypothetical protein DSO57_1004798 [Entomophthora muscae]